MSRSFHKWLMRRFSPTRPIRRRTRLAVSLLEDRTVPTLFTVTIDADPIYSSINAAGQIQDAGTYNGKVSLHSAIQAANQHTGADAIGFYSATGSGVTNFYDGSPHTIFLSLALPDITDSLIIAGAGAPRTLVDANGHGRVFTITHGTGADPLAVTFDRLTIEHGGVGGNPNISGGGVRFLGGTGTGDTLTITNSSVSGNVASAGLGADYVGGKAYGGGIFTTGVAVTLARSTLANNLARGGDSEALPVIDTETVAQGVGGGLYADGGSTVTVTDCTITGNTALGGDGTLLGGRGGRGYGGGLYTHDMAVTMSGTMVANNLARAGNTKALPYQGYKAVAHGGGLFADGLTTMTVTNATIAGNTAVGGLVEVENDDFDTGTTFVAGAADGGGLFFHSAAGTQGSTVPLFFMTDSQVTDNLAEGGACTDGNDRGFVVAGDGVAGGVDVLTTAGSDVTAQGEVRNSTVAGNTAQGGTAFIANINIGGFTAGSAAGGEAYVGGVGVSRLINSTVYDNQAVGGHAEAFWLIDGVTEEDPGAAFGGRAGGGGFGPGYGKPAGALDGYLFAYLPAGVSYTIANSTIFNNAAVPGTSFTNYGYLSFGGGVDDGSPDIVLGPPSYMTHFDNVLLYSTIVAGNTVVGFNVDAGADIVGGRSRGLNMDPNVKGHNLIGVEAPLSAPNFLSGGTNPNPPFNILPNGNGDLAGPDNNGPLDPGLGTFGYHGGPTKTLIPDVDGLAADNGENAGLSGVFVPLATDQRDGSYLRRYIVTLASSLNYSDGTDVGAAELQPADSAAPQVFSIQVNDGSVQRSEVRSLTVFFTGPVTYTGNPFTLTKQGTGGGPVDLVANLAPNGMSVVLTFQDVTNTDRIDQVSTQNGGVPSLTDGVYQLAIADGAVTGLNGASLDGDGNGSAGGAYLSPLDTAGTGSGYHYGLYRLFGDSTGNAVVDLLDLSEFRGTFNRTGPDSIDPLFLPYFDSDNSNNIDLLDLAQFRSRFNVSLF